MEEYKQEFDVRDLYVALVAPIKYKEFWEEYYPICKKAKYIIVKVIDGKIVDVIDQRQTSYRQLNHCKRDYLRDNSNALYIYDYKKLMDFKKYRFTVKITLEEIINLYFKLNKIKDENVKNNIIENSTLLLGKEHKINDVVLNRILEIKDSIINLDEEVKNGILSDLVEIANYYVESLIKSNSSNELSNNKVDVQLECMQRLSGVELKIHRLKNGEINSEELLEDLKQVKYILK